MVYLLTKLNKNQQDCYLDKKSNKNPSKLVYLEIKNNQNKQQVYLIRVKIRQLVYLM